MNSGRSWWPACIQQLREQRATLGRASTKVRMRQVLARGAKVGRERSERSVPGRWEEGSQKPPPEAGVEVGKKTGRLARLLNQSGLAHLPPAPPWSPLAALAMLRLRTLRGRAIVEGRLGLALPFSVSFTLSRGSPPLSEPITC